MRSETEMINLIKETAYGDSRIRGAYLEGSRANPNVPRDIFQDYDVVYIVEETKSFQDDKSWIDRFGQRLYMQYPEENACFPSDTEHCYGWLMQFADGNRLDLHVCTWNHAINNMELYIVLVDKDQIFPNKQMISDKMYWVKKPAQELFSLTCNEFWWCLNNVAKGLWRKEILYVMDILNSPVRPMLRQVLEWKIGLETDFSVNLGKSAKYMNEYLSKNLYETYLKTYPNACIDDIWEAVFLMCRLFHDTALEISKKMNLFYDLTEEQNSRNYLKHIRNLPTDAKEIY